MLPDAPFELRNSADIPLYLQLKQHLLAEIDNGRWKPGERLPGDDELCRAHQISRTTVRQAMKELEIAGLIVRYRGRGTFLASPKYSHSPDPPYRLTDKLGARGLVAGWQVLEAGPAPAPPTVAAALQIEEGSEVFHVRRLRLAGEEVLGLVTSHARIEASEIAAESLERGPSLQYLADVMSLAGSRVDRVIEAVGASADEAALLEIDVGAPLIHVRRVLWDATGRPIEHYRGAYRGDRFQYNASGEVHEVETRGASGA